MPSRVAGVSERTMQASEFYLAGRRPLRHRQRRRRAPRRSCPARDVLGLAGAHSSPISGCGIAIVVGWSLRLPDPGGPDRAVLPQVRRLRRRRLSRHSLSAARRSALVGGADRCGDADAGAGRRHRDRHAGRRRGSSRSRRRRPEWLSSPLVLAGTVLGGMRARDADGARSVHRAGDRFPGAGRRSSRPSPIRAAAPARRRLCAGGRHRACRERATLQRSPLGSFLRCTADCSCSPP